MEENNDATNRMADKEGDNENLETFSWSWSEAEDGGAINMYMYNNTMSMENTVFTMTAGEEGMTGAGSSELEVNGDKLERMAGATQYGTNINMYMYDNEMSMNKTVFTWKVGGSSEGESEGKGGKGGK